MITHENLVEAVYGDNHSWSCPHIDTGEQCSTDISCTDCVEQQVTEYENALREEGKRLALAEALKPYDVEDIDDLIRNVKNKTIEEMIGIVNARLMIGLGLENATKYGNANSEQQANSYSTLMRYEIADAVEDLIDAIEQMKEGGENGRS